MSGRYSRQELFAPIGPSGQALVAASRVLLVGCGALGTHLAEFCVRAGVGELTIIDRDVVDASNLGRQSLFTEADMRAALPKAVAAQRHLAAINGLVKLNAIVGEFAPENAENLAADSTLILDATDNFAARFLINDVAVKLNKPWVYAGCVASRAVCMPVIPRRSACLACLLDSQPAADGETCETSGIILPAVLQAVSWASVVALKIMSGNEQALFKRMFTVDLWSGERTSVDASKPRADCPVCVGRVFRHLNAPAGARAATLCGRRTVQLRPEAKLDFAAARQRLAATGKVLVNNEYLLRLADGSLELTLFADGRALVHGTSDAASARALYSRFIGS